MDGSYFLKSSTYGWLILSEVVHYVLTFSNFKNFIKLLLNFMNQGYINHT